MSSIAVFNNQVAVAKLQEVHTSPYYQQKEKRKRTQSEMSVDSGYSADSPMEMAVASPEPASSVGLDGGPWGMFKSREAFLEMHVC